MDPMLVEPAGSVGDRLRAFRFEEQDGRPFCEVLADATGWPQTYAQRVVEEYRRFLWLAVTSGGLVSPPPAVDEAWHLHLLDTRSYWQRLCPFVLGRPLHHVRSAGTLAERKQLTAAYARTLEAYRRAFGEPPPDIWPPAAGARRTAAQSARPALRHAAALLAAASCGAAACAGSTPALAVLRAVFGVGELPFLAALGALAVAIHAAGIAYARRARGPAGAPERGEVAALDRYDVAYLADGARGAVEVAVVELVTGGMLDVAAAVPHLVSSDRPPSPLTPVHKLVLEAVRRRQGVTLAEQLPTEDQVRSLLEPALVGAGLLVAPARRRARAAWIVGGSLLLAALDLTKLVVDVRDHTTTGLPFVCWQLFLAGALSPLVAPLFRTRRGDAALAARRAAFDLPPQTSSAVEDFATVVSLFGAPALRGSTLAELGELLRPPSSPAPSCGCGG